MNPIKTWCFTLQQPSNIRHALEYLAINQHADELEQLINKINNEQPTRELTEWANGYSILLSYLKGHDVSEILSDLRVYTPKSLEMKLLAIIIEMYCKIWTKEYNSAFNLAKGMDISISEIKEEFIKESLGLRLKEILSNLYLYRMNDPEKARDYAIEIISSDLCATLSTNASYILGMSYLFNNYEKCLGNILEYREKLIRYGRHEHAKVVDKSDLPFIKNVWNKHTEQPKTSDISELAHYEALYGSKELALESIDKALEQKVTGFRLYYKALATNDKSHFMQALIFFCKKGDKFFANLPYEHLKGDPVYQPMADMMVND